MFKATQAIYTALKASRLELKVFTDENEAQSVVWLQFPVKNGPPYRIQFISRDDDNDVAVRIFSLIHVESSQIEKVLPAINEVNTKYRYVKFVIDKDGDINVEYDFLVKALNVDNCAEEIVIRFVKILDEAYPVLMHALWA